MVSAISSLTAASAAQLSSPTSAPSHVSTQSSSSDRLAPDTVSIGPAARKASAGGDVDHDGDSR
ncbi:MAG: hypothetical protein ACP5E2_09485 [Terracidiphilus sp.]